MDSLGTSFVIFSITLMLFVVSMNIAAHTETQKEIRNELQTLNTTLIDRIQCIPKVFEGTVDLKIGRAG